MYDRELNEKLFTFLSEKNFLYMRPNFLCNYGSMEVSVFDNSVRLGFIRVNEEDRRKGIGSLFLKILKEFATENNLPIVLEVDASHGVGKRALNAFYKDNGFVKSTRRNAYPNEMIWNPVA